MLLPHYEERRPRHSPPPAGTPSSPPTPPQRSTGQTHRRLAHPRRRRAIDQIEGPPGPSPASSIRLSLQPDPSAQHRLADLGSSTYVVNVIV